MALPRKLKNLNVFQNGTSFLGEVKTVTLPTLSRTMEDWRGGGMDGAVGVDLGQEPIELEHTYGGFMLPILRQYGAVGVGTVGLRFAGAYQRDDTGAVDAVEIVIRGRHSEIEPGEATGGEDTEFNVTTRCAYYALRVNGVVEIEIDLLNMIFIVDGVDILALQREALGI